MNSATTEITVDAYAALIARGDGRHGWLIEKRRVRGVSLGPDGAAYVLVDNGSRVQVGGSLSEISERVNAADRFVVLELPDGVATRGAELLPDGHAETNRAPRETPGSDRGTPAAPAPRLRLVSAVLVAASAAFVVASVVNLAAAAMLGGRP